jgi:hypothetical protein
VKLNKSGHVILVDDAELFFKTRKKLQYPPISEFRDFICGFALNRRLEIENNIISIFVST